MRYRLVFLSGSQAGRVREIAEDDAEIVLGRDPGVHVLFPAEERLVSRRHALLAQEAGALILRDLDSTSGTFLDGQDVEEAELVDGDVLELGRGGPRLRVEFVDAGTVVAAPAPPEAAPRLAPRTPSPAALDPAARLRLTLLTGTRQGERLELAGAVVRIGRAPGSTIHLPAEPLVSFQHAKVVRLGGAFVLMDLDSTNGTFVNGTRVERARLAHGDLIQLGTGGPALRFEILLPDQDADGAHATIFIPHFAELATRRTAGVVVRELPVDRPVLTIGRDPQSDLALDAPIVSKRHARIVREGDALIVEDLGSANGTYLAAQRIQRAALALGDCVVVGPFQIEVLLGRLRVLDTRNRARLDATGLGVRAGGRAILEDVALCLAPGSFSAIIGPSGAGKSTLLRALCGETRAHSGSVLLNGVDLYQDFPALKASLGIVPQDDIVHRELTVQETLDYTARLRLPSDTTTVERHRRVESVLRTLELSDRAQQLVGRLSGGQRKRVAIATELLTEPSLLFLDEPAAGLDPALEESLMLLLRELSYKGKTVVLVTHSLDAVHLCDALVLLVGGRLAYVGNADDLAVHFEIPRLPALYPQLKERPPEAWARAFRESAAYHARVREPLAMLPNAPRETPAAIPVAAPPHPLRQFAVCTQRYLTTVLRDRRNAALLLAQAPVIGVLIALSLLYGPSDVAFTKPVNTILFLLALSAVWFGCSNAARELVKERAIYLRERMVNLGILPYLASKVAVLGLLASAQCVTLLAILGIWFGIPGWAPWLLAGMLCASMVGILMGLTLSAVAAKADRAMTLLPLLLMPQVLFTIPAVQMDMQGPAGIIAHAMPTWWSFDLLRRVALAPDVAAPSEVTAARLSAGDTRLMTRQRFEEMFREGYPVFEYRSRIELTWTAGTPARLARYLPAGLGDWRPALVDVAALAVFAAAFVCATVGLLRRLDRRR